jgi:integrase
MHYIRREYEPKRFGGDTRPLSASAVDNHWKALRSFFGWCNRTLDVDRPDLNMQRPKFQLPEVNPLSEKEIRSLVKVCEYSKVAATKDRQAYSRRRPTAKRDKALLLLLIDTGLRLGEIHR